MKKDKSKSKHGGPRTARPGKRLGRPTKFTEPMQRCGGVRMPKAWIAAIVQHGQGDFAQGLRQIIEQSGIVQSTPSDPS